MIDTNKYLPLGSVVKLNDLDDKIMIIGYMPYGTVKEGNIASDYSGVRVSEGYNYDNAIMFNKDNITNIIFMGYKNEIIIKRLKKYDALLKLLKSDKEDDNVDRVLNRIITSGTKSNIVDKPKNILVEELKQ
jgi:hypothetical protein